MSAAAIASFSVLSALRRSFAAGLAALFCTAALGAGAADADAFDPRKVRIALGKPITTLDQSNAVDQDTRFVLKSVYEGLVGLNEKLEVVPQLAQSWRVAEDGLSMDFTLRSGVFFHDGSPLTAQAAKASFDRLLDPKNALARRQPLDFIREATVVAPNVLRLTLDAPAAVLLKRLAVGGSPLVCPSLLKTPEKIKSAACGTGPYKFVSSLGRESLVLERNPDYWGKKPKVGGILWEWVGENHTRAVMLRTGETDIAHPLPFEERRRIEALAAQPGRSAGMKVLRAGGLQARFLMMNTAHPALSDPRVREAVFLAISRDAIVKAVYDGSARPADGMLPPEIDGAVRFPGELCSPERARSILSELGLEGKLELPLWSAYNDASASRAAQLIAQQLTRVGIRTTLRFFESGERAAMLGDKTGASRRGMALYFTGWSNSAAEADWGLRPLFDSRKRPPVLQNTANFINPEVDQLLDDAFVEPDDAKRSALYRRVQEILWTEKPGVPLVFEDVLTGVSGAIEGVKLLPNGDLDLSDMRFAAH